MKDRELNGVVKYCSGLSLCSVEDSTTLCIKRKQVYNIVVVVLISVEIRLLSLHGNVSSLIIRFSFYLF
jgi:hypothetical protein